MLLGVYKARAPLHWDFLDDATFAKVLAVLRQGVAAWLHVAPPCSSFPSTLRSIARVRSATDPVGPEAAVAAVWEANELARRSVACCAAQAAAGGLWTWENPTTSLMRRLPEVAECFASGKKVIFDQCQFGAHQDLAPIRKRTTVWGNGACTQGLHRRCDGQYEHLVFAGTWWDPARQRRLPRTLSAASYPNELSKEMCRVHEHVDYKGPADPAVYPELRRQMLLEAGEVEPHRGRGGASAQRATKATSWWRT